MQVKKRFLCAIVLILVLSAIIPSIRAEAGEDLDEKEVIKRCNKIYYDSGVWDHMTWLGVQSLQTPCDNWMMQEMIYEIKPDFIVETGTYKGGSAFFYASILEFARQAGKVITVDIENLMDAKTANADIFKRRVEFILGDSVSPEVVDAIQKKVKGSKVIVTLDSLHTKDHVLKELKLYSDFVSVGSYMVVQDTNLNGNPVLPGFGPGPMEAVQEFLKTDDRFVIDHSRERYLLTFYPSGYLKRVK